MAALEYPTAARTNRRRTLQARDNLISLVSSFLPRLVRTGGIFDLRPEHRRVDLVRLGRGDRAGKAVQSTTHLVIRWVLSDHRTRRTGGPLQVHRAVRP